MAASWDRNWPSNTTKAAPLASIANFAVASTPAFTPLAIRSRARRRAPARVDVVVRTTVHALLPLGQLAIAPPAADVAAVGPGVVGAAGAAGAGAFARGALARDVGARWALPD